MVQRKNGVVIEEESPVDRFLKKRKNQQKITVTEGKDTINRKNKQSFHKIAGGARDVRTRNLSSGERKNLVKSAKDKGFFAQDEGDHIHIDVGTNLPKEQRKNVFDALKEDKRGVLSRGKDATDIQREKDMGFADDLTSVNSIINLREKEGSEDEIASHAASVVVEEKNPMVKQAQGAALLQTDAGQRNIASSVDSLPENVRRTVIEDMQNPDKVSQSVMRSKKAKLEGGDSTIKDNFLDAVTFFLPTAIGGLVGGALGGTEGALQGAKDATSLGGAFRSHQLKKEELSQKKTKAGLTKSAKFQQSDFVDKKGDPLTFNPDKNEYTKSDGTIAKAGDFKDPIDARQAKNLILRARTVKVSEIKLKHQLAKDTQLSDKQVERFESMTTVLDSVDRIDTISNEVATGLGRGQFQSFGEFFDAAPEEFTAMKSETNSALAAYVKSISGAQVSELEAERLKAIIPNVNDAPSVFQTKLKTFRTIVKANKKAFKRAIISGQPLKAGTILGLDKAENDLKQLTTKGSSSSDKINAMSPEKRKRYEEFLAKRNK